MTKRVTPERMNELELDLANLEKKKKVTREELESILHKLLWISSCVRSSRVFVSRIITLMKSVKNAITMSS